MPIQSATGERENRTQHGTCQHIPGHVLLRGHGGVDNEYAPKNLNGLDDPSHGQFAQQPVQPKTAVHGRGHVQRWAGVSGRVHILEKRHSGVLAPVNVCPRNGVGPQIESRQCEQAHGADPNPKMN